MNWPKFKFVSKRDIRHALQLSESQRQSHSKEAGRLAAEFEALKTSANGQAQADARETRRLQDALAHAHTINATKQTELADVRRQLEETRAELKEARAEARDDRQKYVDWITNGLTGTPVFSKPVEPETAAPEAPPKPPDPVTEPVPSEVQKAIFATGSRKARAIVNHISKEKEIDFEATMARAGVTRIFEADRAEAEVEATLTTAQRKEKTA